MFLITQLGVCTMPHLHVGLCQQSFEFSYTLFLPWSRCLRGVRNDVHVLVEHNHLENIRTFDKFTREELA